MIPKKITFVKSTVKHDCIRALDKKGQNGEPKNAHGRKAKEQFYNSSRGDIVVQGMATSYSLQS